MPLLIRVTPMRRLNRHTASAAWFTNGSLRCRRAGTRYLDDGKEM